MKWEISRCYDSHTHLLGSGMMQRGLRLFDLQNPEQMGSLKIERHHFRGDWLVGFGWDHTKWSPAQFPTAEQLDQFFPDFPVALSRTDGHALWVNTKALQLSGYHQKTELQKSPPAGGVIIRDQNGFPSGVFVEMAKIEIEQLIPSYTRTQKLDFLREAIRYFNHRGFSHLRDMSGTWGQWELLRELDQKGELSLYIEQNFTCENLEDFERALSEAKRAREESNPHLRVGGIKFYFDGALGSQGAFLSQFYPGTSSKGVTLWPLEDVEKVVEKSWREGFGVCVHTIGDEAAHQIAQTILKVQNEKNISGLVNIEHGEILRPETIEMLSRLQTVCHIQPCHWLSDRRWLKEKLPELYQFAFPWQALQKKGVTIQWGSDSPIEEASVPNNWKALTESPSEGIPAFQGDLLLPHRHRDEAWGPHCKTTFKDGQVAELIFDGQKLI